jgi:hypothetical protein
VGLRTSGEHLAELDLIEQGGAYGLGLLGTLQLLAGLCRVGRLLLLAVARVGKGGRSALFGSCRVARKFQLEDRLVIFELRDTLEDLVALEERLTSVGAQLTLLALLLGVLLLVGVDLAQVVLGLDERLTSEEDVTAVFDADDLALLELLVEALAAHCQYICDPAEYRENLRDVVGVVASAISAHLFGDEGPNVARELAVREEVDHGREYELVDLTVEEGGFRHGGETLDG